MPARPTPPLGLLGINRRPSRREWRGALVLFTVGVVGLVLALLFVHPRASLIPVGSPVPAVALPDDAGRSVNVTQSAAGRPYVVEFFEAGCSHCQQAASQLCNERVPVFAVDAGIDSASTIGDYRHRYAPGCTYPMLVDPSLSAAKAFAVNAVPTVYLVVSGKVAYAGSGLDGIAGLGSAINKALGG